MFIQTFFLSSGSLRKNLWDAEDRLRAVDLSPENDADKPLVAIYTYDAGGERTIKYVPARIDARYSAKEAGSADRLAATIYPSALLTAKILPIPEGGFKGNRQILKYTKHYYTSTSLSTGIGSERIASYLGTRQSVGMYCDQETTLIAPLDAKVLEARQVLEDVFAHFDKTIDLDMPYLYGNSRNFVCGPTQLTEAFGAYWYHPDHLGSSSYITNLSGEITQHTSSERRRRVEYLPFGELLVEEHLNSYNSPFKFNAKEFDAETGNYYYGARYYDPKYNLMLSVDQMYELYPSFSPYAYTLQNPVRYVDPTGMTAEDYDDWYKNQKGDLVWYDNDSEAFSDLNGNTWTNVGANEQEVKQNLNIPKDKHVPWNTYSGVSLGGTDRMGNRGGSVGPVVLKNNAHIKFDLNIEGTEGILGKTLVDGQSTITGVNITIDLSSETGAPGVQLTHIGGDFGLKNWTPMGKINTTTSSSFSDLSYPTISPLPSHASGTATMNIPLSQYRSLSRNFSKSPNLNIGIKSSAGFRLQSSTSSRPRSFNTSNTIRY